MIVAKPLDCNDKDALLSFIKEAYPARNNPEEFLDRTVFSRPSNEWSSSIAIWDDAKIVGINMFVETYVTIGGKEHKIVWSYDTMILPQYRNTDASSLLMSNIYKRKDSFGAGLSDIAVEMNKIMKSKFIAYASAYLKVNITSKYLANFFYNFFSLKYILSKNYPINIIGDNYVFNRVNTVDEIRLPNSDYWNCDIIEFNRNHKFLQWRFFQQDSKYTLYKLIENIEQDGDTYFAARIIEWHNLPLLYIVDYRFNLRNISKFDLILKAAYKLCKTLRCAGVYIRSSLNHLEPSLKKHKFVRKGLGTQIVTRYKPAINNDIPVLVTAADSDIDFK